jgi:hypothetical protein
MAYTEIVSMLDAEIARLEKARELLLELLPAAAALKPVRTAAGEQPTPPVDERAAEEQEAVAIKVLRPRRSYTPRTKRNRVATEPDGALRTSVPAGPVAVSADDVRRRLQLQKGAAAAPSPLPAKEPLTWRAEAEQARRGGDLLQRFMEMGS